MQLLINLERESVYICENTPLCSPAWREPNDGDEDALHAAITLLADTVGISVGGVDISELTEARP